MSAKFVLTFAPRPFLPPNPDFLGCILRTPIVDLCGSTLMAFNRSTLGAPVDSDCCSVFNEGLDSFTSSVS